MYAYTLKAEQKKKLGAALKQNNRAVAPSQSKVRKGARRATQGRGRENISGLPDPLKRGIEQLSGYSMDDVRVHYNSPKPARLQALAYAQGTDIYIAPGQEYILPHEAWHVVQQKQGRVKPTIQLKGGIQVNDNARLEHEADVMGIKAISSTTQHQGLPIKEEMLLDKFAPMQSSIIILRTKTASTSTQVIQRALVRIRTARHDQEERVIESVEFEGRMPTNLTTAQGQHTVASSLITGSAAALKGMTRSQGIEHIRQLAMQTLPENISAGQGNSITLKTLYTKLNETSKLIEQKAEGEDINSALEDAFEVYIRLANKRVNTALRVDSTRIEMGGDEKEGLKILKALKEELKNIEEPTENEFNKFAWGCVRLVDFIPKHPLEIPMLAEILVRATDHGLFLVNDPDLEQNYEALPRYVVTAWLLCTPKEFQTAFTKQYLDELVSLVWEGLMPVYSDNNSESDEMNLE